MQVPRGGSQNTQTSEIKHLKLESSQGHDTLLIVATAVSVEAGRHQPAILDSMDGNGRLGAQQHVLYTHISS